MFLPNWPYFECIWPFWSYLASFCHFGLQKWLFSYMNLKNFFLYCQVKAILGNVEQSSFKHSCKKGFLGTNVITCYPLLIGNFEPENGTFNRDFKEFSMTTSKVPSFYLLWGHFWVKNSVSI